MVRIKWKKKKKKKKRKKKQQEKLKQERLKQEFWTKNHDKNLKVKLNHNKKESKKEKIWNFKSFEKPQKNGSKIFTI